MDVSVIIVNWNTKDHLRICLSSIYSNGSILKYEVIVVDNASCDGSGEMVKEKFPEAILLQNDKNVGFAAANNLGIAVAKGRYILLLNSDTIILDDVISKTVSFADLHREIAVVGCKVLNPDRTLQSTCFMFPSLLNMLLSSTYFYKLFPRNRFFGREQMTWWDRNDVREVEVVTGCFMLVRREAMEQVGLLDERFFMYGEETDWCYRFRQAGWKVIFAPVGKIIHIGGRSSQKVREDMIIQIRLSILKFMNKHSGFISYKVACLFTMFFFAVRVPLWFLVSLIGSKSNKKQGAIKLWAYLSGIKHILSAFIDA